MRRKPPAKPAERCRWHVTGSGGVRCVMRWSRAAEPPRVLWHDSLLDGFTPAGICFSSTPQFRRSTSSFSNSRTIGPVIVSLPLNQAWLSHVKLGGKTPEFPRLSELSWVNLWGVEQVFLKRTEVEQALGLFTEVKVVELQQRSVNNLNSIYSTKENEMQLLIIQ